MGETEQPELFDVGDRTPAPKQKITCTPNAIGTGPAGATCNICANYRRVKYHGKIFLKCGLMETSWTHGPGSDIKAKWPACSYYEKREGKAELYHG